MKFAHRGMKSCGWLMFFAFAVQSAFASQETEMIVGGGSVNGNLANQRTAWYGWSASANAGYCVTLSTTAGNADLYLLDTGFNIRASSLNAGLAQDKIWFGQAAAGRLHAASWGADASTSSYSISVIASPVISTINPTSGAVGTTVTLTGFGFGASQGSSAVKFGAVTATSYPSWSNTSIQAVVPAGAAGSVPVTVTVLSAVSNSLNFDAAAGPSSDTTMWRYNLARTSEYPNGPVTFPLTAKWTADGKYNASPVLANGSAYTPVGGVMKSYNAVTGALNWTWTPPPSDTTSNVSTPAAASNGMLYFANNYFVSGSGGFTKIYCVNATTGTTVWSYSAGANAQHSWTSTPAVFNGTVYTGVDNGTFLALDAANGALRWSYAAGVRFESSAAVAGGVVFVPSVNRMYAFDAATGAVRWSVAMPGWTHSSPAVSGSTVYVASNDGKVYAFDTANGAVRWTYNTGAWVSAYRSSPAISGGTLYIGTGDAMNKVIALNATTGALVWSYTATSATWPSSPAVSNGSVYITSRDGKLLALNSSNGTLRWSVVLGANGTDSSPAVSGVNVYVNGYNTGGLQKLHCFGP